MHWITFDWKIFLPYTWTWFTDFIVGSPIHDCPLVEGSVFGENGKKYLVGPTMENGALKIYELPQVPLFLRLILVSFPTFKLILSS